MDITEEKVECWGNLGDCENCGKDEMDCDCSEDVCCYDPRYSGSEDYCACAEFAKQQELEEKIANDPTLCKVCGEPHLLKDEDAGSEREIKRQCEKCFTRTTQAQVNTFNCDEAESEMDDLPF